jgi:uncharacterized protein YndB with AHSA1/START domain
MGLALRALKFLIVLLLLAVVVLWFAARRTDSGYFSYEVTIDRPAPAVFRWLITDDLMRRWMADSRVEKTGTAPAAERLAYDYRIDESVASRPVSLNCKITRAVPNEQLDILVWPAIGPAGAFISNVEIKLAPFGDYTRLTLSSQTKYQLTLDQIIEPVLTYAMQKKVQSDLQRLKSMLEAESPQPEPRTHVPKPAKS